MGKLVSTCSFTLQLRLDEPSILICRLKFPLMFTSFNHRISKIKFYESFNNYPFFLNDLSNSLSVVRLVKKCYKCINSPILLPSMKVQHWTTDDDDDEVIIIASS